MLSKEQERNYAFFESHLSEYLNDPTKKNKYAVFYDQSLQGTFDTFESALNSACDNYELGKFIIQQIIDPSEVVEFLWTGVR